MQKQYEITKKLIKTVLLGLGLWLIIGAFAPFFEEMQPFERAMMGIIMILIAYTSKLRTK